MNVLYTTQAWVSLPKVGKHIMFSGSLLHAAPSDFLQDADHSDSTSSSDESSSGSSGESGDDGGDGYSTVSLDNKRVTFLVNIWLDHLPSQAGPFPPSLFDANPLPQHSSSATPLLALDFSHPTSDLSPDLHLTLNAPDSSEPVRTITRKWAMAEGMAIPVRCRISVPLPADISVYLHRYRAEEWTRTLDISGNIVLDYGDDDAKRLFISFTKAVEKREKGDEEEGRCLKRAKNIVYFT